MTVPPAWKLPVREALSETEPCSTIVVADRVVVIVGLVLLTTTAVVPLLLLWTESPG